MLGVLLVVYTIVIWIVFHMIFTVYYRNIGQGILHELLYSLIGAAIFTALTVTYWKVLIIAIVVVGVIFIVKAPGLKKIFIALVVIILSVCILGANREYESEHSQKEEKEEMSDEEFMEAVEELQNYYIVCNSNSALEGFVQNGETYVSHDSGIKWINMEYYPDEWNSYRIDIDAYFTTNNVLDSRRLYQSFYSEERLFPAYFLSPSDPDFNEDFYLLVNGDGTVTIEYREEDIDISGQYKLASQSDVDEYDSLCQQFLNDLEERENQLLIESLGHIHNLTYTYNGNETHTATCIDETCDYSEVEECSFYRGTCSYCVYTWHLADRRIQEGEYTSPYRENLTVSLKYNENDNLILSYISPELAENISLTYNYDGDSFEGEIDSTRYWLTGGYLGTYENDKDDSDIYLTIYHNGGETENMTLYITN